MYLLNFKSSSAKIDSRTAILSRKAAINVSRENLVKNLEDFLKNQSILFALAGKTTSALNRPKSSSDSKSKSSNRKTGHGHIDEEGTYQQESEEEVDERSKEKERDSEEIDEPPHEAVFREVTEVRFPAEVGPLGTHRLCKIKCIDGMWQGPLCAAPDQDESGQLKFEPLYKRCVVDNIPPHLLLSYKNVSVVCCYCFITRLCEHPEENQFSMFFFHYLTLYIYHVIATQKNIYLNL